MSENATLEVHIERTTSTLRLDVRFDVPPGMTLLWGPSGAGKSTILACIAGLVRPDTGRVVLGGAVWFDSEKAREQPPEQRRVAYVFQSLALFPHQTAVENVAYGIPKGKRGTERRDEALAMLLRMRVLHLADRLPHTFSGGEAQRVALARAFAMSPRVLLLDEPFAALDASLKHELIAEVREIVHSARIPALVVTHDALEARTLGERIVMIETGKVVHTGALNEATLALPERSAAAK